MLRDKDAAGVAEQLRGRVDRWYLAPTVGPRGMDSQTLAASVQPTGAAMNRYDSVGEALTAARAAAGPDDRILVFGSFVTVAEAMRDLQRSGQE
jgi:dihydrofolate synthase/folylpolyglutamate synthase